MRQIQLVHESVLSIEHFLRNANEGITTVILLDSDNQSEAHDHLDTFLKRISNVVPKYNPSVFGYCLRTPTPACRLFKEVSELLQNSNANGPILN